MRGMALQVTERDAPRAARREAARARQPRLLAAARRISRGWRPRMPIDARHPKEIRADIRSGQAHGRDRRARRPATCRPTSPCCRREQAYDFLLFCQRNPRPCPLLEVTDVGLARAGRRRAGRRPAHGHSAVPHLQGRRARRRGDRRHAVLARRSRRLPARLLVHVRVGAARGRHPAAAPRAGQERRDVADVDRVPARRASSTARWSSRCGRSRRRMLSKAVTASARFPGAHGAPVHVGDPGAIGITDIDTPDWGDCAGDSGRATCRCSGRAA